MRERIWRLEEIDLLQRAYASHPAAHVAALLDRTVDSVTSMARRLGLTSPDRYRKQAASRAAANPNLDVTFFNQDHPETAFVLGFIRRWGRVRTSPRFVLRLRCPKDQGAALLAVRALLRSRHRVQHFGRSLVLEFCSRPLVESLLSKHGPF